jgi:hypothetical protein
VEEGISALAEAVMGQSSMLTRGPALDRTQKKFISVLTSTERKHRDLRGTQILREFGHDRREMGVEEITTLELVPYL